jgi:hypothetical protein
MLGPRFSPEYQQRVPRHSADANGIFTHFVVREPRDSARIWKQSVVLVLFFECLRRYHRVTLFEAPQEELTDEEVAAVLRQSMCDAGRLPRHADAWLAGICAEHPVDGLRAAGLIVARPVNWRLHQ